MSCDDEIKSLLVEIRDNQRRSLERQEEHLAVAREQVERANQQVTESLALQNVALGRARQLARIVVPGILVCIGLVIYLIVKYL